MNYNLIVQRIDWLDKDGKEADVLFKLGESCYWAFCQPCEFSEGENYVVGIDFLSTSDISWEVMFSGNANKEQKIIPSERDIDAYYCYGKIISINPVLVDCGDIQFDLGDLTADIKVVNSYIYFAVDRLDIIQKLKD